MITTLNKIKKHRPCDPEWRRGLTLLGKTAPDDEPISMVDVLDNMGINAALWCTQTLPEHDCEWRLFAVWCARQNLDLLVYEGHREALEVAEAYALGQVGQDALGAAARGVCGSMPSPVNTGLWQASSCVSFATSPSASFAARCSSGWSRLISQENMQPQIDHLRSIFLSS
jgi:hypothetical protein